MSDVPLQFAADASNKSGGIVSFPVDVPLRAEYDTDTGVLTIETPVVHAGVGGGRKPPLFGGEDAGFLPGTEGHQRYGLRDVAHPQCFAKPARDSQCREALARSLE